MKNFLFIHSFEEWLIKEYVNNLRGNYLYRQYKISEIESAELNFQLQNQDLFALTQITEIKIDANYSKAIDLLKCIKFNSAHRLIITATTPPKKNLAILTKLGAQTIRLAAPSYQELPNWIQQKWQAAGFKICLNTAANIAQNYYANLGGCNDLLEQIKILYPIGNLPLSAIAPLLKANSNFTVFDLLKNIDRSPEDVTLTLNALQTNLEPSLAIWALNQKIIDLLNAKTKTKFNRPKSYYYNFLLALGKLDIRYKSGAEIWPDLLEISLALATGNYFLL